MTNQDLYRALGEADDTFLLECEAQPVRRVPRRFGIIAAVVALMLTACAPAAVQTFHALKEASVTRTESFGYYELEPSVYEIWVDIDIAQDAPTSVETVYLPTAMKDYGSNLTCDKKEWSVSFYHTRKADDPEESIDFHQSVYPAAVRTGDKFVLGEFYGNTDTEPQVSKLTFDDTAVLDIIHESPVHSREAGASYVEQRTVFWSDGYYLFFMNLPPSWSTDQIREMVESLSVVEDLSEFHVLKN